MTVLSRGARGRRGGRRPGWVLLTALLVLAMGASSALVFTNRVELLKLAVILALWAAVAGAFVSVLYRRQSDADQSRVRDLKLVYDLQLDREISARREYELTVESQLRRELASEIRAQADDDLAALRAEVAALRTSLEILFDTDLEQRPALGTMETDTPPARAYSDWDRNGEAAGVDWVTSDRVTSVREGNPVDSAEPRTDESAIIDVPEVGVPPASAASGGPLLPPRARERARLPIRRPPRAGLPAAAGPTEAVSGDAAVRGPAGGPVSAPADARPGGGRAAIRAPALAAPPAAGAATRATTITGAAARIGAARLAAGSLRRPLAAAGSTRQQLGARRFTRCTRRTVRPASALPAFQPRGAVRGPVGRARAPSASRRIRPSGTLPPFRGVPRLFRRELRRTERARRSAAPRSCDRATTAAARQAGTSRRGAAATPTRPRAAPGARTPPPRRGLRARRARQPGRGPANRRSVGRRPAGAAAGAAIRRWPASSPGRLSWDLPHIGSASPNRLKS